MGKLVMLYRRKLTTIAIAFTVSLFTFVGCSNQPTDKTTTLKDTTDQPALIDESSLNDLLMLTANLKSAIQAGDIEEAKVTFSRIQETWEPLKAGIKEKERTAYEGIEVHLDNIRKNLKRSELDTADTLSNLNLLEITINDIPQ